MEYLLDSTYHHLFPSLLTAALLISGETPSSLLWVPVVQVGQYYPMLGPGMGMWPRTDNQYSLALEAPVTVPRMCTYPILGPVGNHKIFTRIIQKRYYLSTAVIKSQKYNLELSKGQHMKVCLNRKSKKEVR